MQRSNGSILIGAVLVLLGIFFLGQMNNWWSYDWIDLVAFWPLLIVAIGLRLLLPAGLAFDLIVIGLLIAAVWAQTLVPPKPEPERRWFGNIFHQSDSTEKTELKGPGISGAGQLRFFTTAAAGTLNLKSLDQFNNRLYTAQLSRSSFQQSDQRDGDTAITELKPKHSAIFGLHRLDYDLALTPKIPIELTLDAGASKTNLDLSDIQLTKLDMDAGATSSVIRLGTKSTRQRLILDIGASSLQLHVPKDAGLKITYDSGLSSNNFAEAGLNQSSDTYTTTDYDQANVLIEIELDGGASSINLERY